MAERVEIIVTAKDTASQVLRGVAGSFGQIGNAVQMLTSGGGLEALTSAVVQFGKESVDATVAYANEVRNLSKVSGQSAEETSRLIQLADDYKIGTNDLTLAVRKLAADGLTLNVETLAKLSDEYKALNPGQERAAFLMDKFGRAGVRFAEIMEQGGDNLRTLNSEIDKNLILTDEAVKAAREYEMAMDAWDEQTQKLQYSLGNALLPVLTDFLNITNETIDKNRESQSAWFLLFPPINAAIGAYNNVTAAIEVYNTKGEETVTVTQEIGNQAALTDEQITALGKDFLNVVQEMSQSEQDFAATLDGIQSKRMEVTAALNAEIAKGAEGSKEAILGYQNQLADLAQQEYAAAQAAELAGRTRILSMLEQQLAIDGLDQKETDYLLNLGLKWGIYSDSAVEAARNAFKEVEALKNQFEGLPTEKTMTVRLTYQQMTEQGYNFSGRANGGPVSAGQLVRVNEFGDEAFQPNSGGHVVPMSSGDNGGGTVVNVTYAPQVSLGNRAEFENILVPLVRDAMRKGSNF